MDKFGIFKLLNSFFNSCGNNKSADGDGNARDNGANFNLSDFLSAFNNQNAAPANEKTAVQQNSAPVAKEQTKRVSPPLQASMLATMSSHDEFIKRVKNKNK